jgi:hypothetical protein
MRLFTNKLNVPEIFKKIVQKKLRTRSNNRELLAVGLFNISIKKGEQMFTLPQIYHELTYVMVSPMYVKLFIYIAKY